MSEFVFGLGLIGTAVLVVVWFSLRPPRGVMSPGDAPHGALVEASVPAESGDLKRSLFPVREVSCTPSRARGVVKGSPTRSGLLFATGSFHASLGEEFVDGWEGEDGADWCPPHGIPRPGLWLVR